MPRPFRQLAAFLGVGDVVTEVSAANPLPVITTAAAGGSKTFAVVAVDDAPAVQLVAANANRKSVLILNDTGGEIFLGKDNTVTTATGLPVASGQPVNDEGSTDAWWAIAAAGVSGNVIVVEVA